MMTQRKEEMGTNENDGNGSHSIETWLAALESITVHYLDARCVRPWLPAHKRLIARVVGLCLCSPCVAWSAAVRLCCCTCHTNRCSRVPDLLVRAYFRTIGMQCRAPAAPPTAVLAAPASWTSPDQLERCLQVVKRLAGVLDPLRYTHMKNAYDLSEACFGCPPRQAWDSIQEILAAVSAAHQSHADDTEHGQRGDS